MTSSDPSVAIVGAGIGGLSCARQLRNSGYRVQVLDKARGVGGRTAVRRAEQGAVFDLGAQYFTVKDATMAQHVEHWKTAGIIAPWEARIGLLSAGLWTPTELDTTRYVGVPGMSAIAKHLAADLDVVLQCHVSRVARDGMGWNLIGDEETVLGTFDVLILNVPAPQSATLICKYPEFAQQIQMADMRPCWAVMLAFEERLDVVWDAAFVDDSPLSWIARNNSKPERPNQPDCWMLHANHAWSSQHLEDSRESVTRELIGSFWDALGMSSHPHRHLSAHRWRYALPEEALEQRCLFDGELRLGACGDWCGGPSIEGAFLSGLAMAELVTTHG